MQAETNGGPGGARVAGGRDFPYPKLAGLRTAEAFAGRLAELGPAVAGALAIEADLEPAPDGPLARPLDCGDGRRAGNRFCVLPMEGWDGTPDGRPTELTERRWERFGRSGAKLVWGGEAVAVRADGRANPHQLLLETAEHEGALAGLRERLVGAHREAGWGTADLVVGLQLTHSGRWARPHPGGRPAPFRAARHPILDRRQGLGPEHPVATDGELDELVGRFVAAGVRARAAGFDFVDIKHCHGYLLHELLGAVDRPGGYGGSFAHRTRFLREVVSGLRREAPGLGLGVRLSLFDAVPYRAGPDGTGEPEPWTAPYRHGFGADPEDPTGAIAWEEPLAFLRLLRELGIVLVCLSAGSPYYCPHVQRPAMVPPSDGYRPPEDPLAGVARQVAAVARARREVPGLVYVGSGYSYLQEWLPHVAQARVRAGDVDAVGLGRMVLSYPGLPADVLAGRPLERRAICRTFSDCTTGPRNGLVSGCFPLDPFYRRHPAAAALKEAKRGG